RHEHASLTLAQRCSAVVASTPLFTTLLNYRYTGTPAAGGGDHESALADFKTVHAEERTNYPLTLSVDDLGEGFQLTALARVPIEPQQVCALMQMAVTQLLEALESAPQTPIRAINVLPEQEKQRQLVEWTAREAEYPQEKCIHELFEEQARRTPDALAVRYEDELVTYRQLNERSNRLAYSLRQQGVGAQSRVGICLGRSVELV